MPNPTATIFVPYHALEAAIGQWTAVPFNAADFTSNAGSWTVEAGAVAAHVYTQIGQTVILTLQLATTTVVAGSPTALLVTLPAGLVAPVAAIGAAAVHLSGWLLGHAIVSGTQVFIQRPDLSAFPDTTTCGCFLTVTFPVN